MKIFEKLLVYRLKNIIGIDKLIPHYEFYFRWPYRTVEQTYKIVYHINNVLDSRRYWSFVLVDLTQDFVRIWYKGLFYKIKLSSSYHWYEMLKSYLTFKHLLVNKKKTVFSMPNKRSCVPGSILYNNSNFCWWSAPLTGPHRNLDF